MTTRAATLFLLLFVAGLVISATASAPWLTVLGIALLVLGATGSGSALLWGISDDPRAVERSQQDAAHRQAADDSHLRSRARHGRWPLSSAEVEALTDCALPGVGRTDQCRSAAEYHGGS